MAKQKLDIDISRLCGAMNRARQVLRAPRQLRYDAVRAYVGRRWSEEGSPKTRPCNLLAQYVSIVGRKLIAHNPRLMLATWSKKAKAVVAAMQDWANKEIENIALMDTLGECVTDALFSVGICKVALATPSDAANMGWRLKAGTPFAEVIDLDDFVFDVHAKRFSEVGFMGHRYRVPLASVKNSKLYSKSRKDLSASSDQIYNMEGDERIGLLGRTTLAGDEEFEDHVDLWEVYLPRHQVVLTLRDDQLAGVGTENATHHPGYGKALRIQKYLGPEKGPYHILALGGKVPNNCMPKGPVQDLYDLDDSINRMLRKLLRQAENQKTVGFVAGGATEDGGRILATNDMEFTRVDNPDKIKIVEFNGPNQQNYMLFEAMKQLFSWLSGNLDVMGGLSPQGDTATQEKLLNANSSASIDEMQQRTLDFSSSVCSALCWYWHHHPTAVMQSEYSVPGLQGMSVVRHVHPQGKGRGPRGGKRLARDHDFEAMQVRVDPYSMPHLTPQQRLQMLNQIVQQTYLPMAQIAQQQGVSLDLNAYFEKVGKYMDEPDIQDILTVQEPPQDTGGSGAGEDSGAGPKPATTTREYTRRSMGAQGDKNQILQRLQAGATPNGQSAGGNGQVSGPR